MTTTATSVETDAVPEAVSPALGWCLTGHHGYEPGVPVEGGQCPGGSDVGAGHRALVCSCRCHRGEDVVRNTVRGIGPGVEDYLDELDRDIP